MDLIQKIKKILCKVISNNLDTVFCLSLLKLKRQNIKALINSAYKLQWYICVCLTDTCSSITSLNILPLYKGVKVD